MAEQDINCRCVALTRARWALDEEQLEQLKERAKFFGIDKTKDFEEFKEKYLNTAQAVQTGGKLTVQQYLQITERKKKQAASAYELIRKANDVSAVAKSSGMTEEEVKIIKEHVFYKKHQLYDRVDVFPPDYDMAVAWKRLVDGKPQQRDILLLKHELIESQFEEQYNISASEAHKMATKKYDWQSELETIFGLEGESDGLL